MDLNIKDYLFVGVQFMLFGAYVFDVPLFEVSVPSFFTAVGISIAISGVIVTILALLQLNKNLSPFPTPKSNAELIQTGLYKFIRHPIYTGIILTTFGYGLYSSSLYRIIITIVLVTLFYFKSVYEEKQLLRKFSNYELYIKSTGRFFPKI